MKRCCSVGRDPVRARPELALREAVEARRADHRAQQRDRARHGSRCGAPASGGRTVQRRASRQCSGDELREQAEVDAEGVGVARPRRRCRRRSSRRAASRRRAAPWSPAWLGSSLVDVDELDPGEGEDPDRGRPAAEPRRVGHRRRAAAAAARAPETQPTPRAIARHGLNGREDVAEQQRSANGIADPEDHVDDRRRRGWRSPSACRRSPRRRRSRTRRRRSAPHSTSSARGHAQHGALARAPPGAACGHSTASADEGDDEHDRGAPTRTASAGSAGPACRRGRGRARLAGSAERGARAPRRAATASRRLTASTSSVGDLLPCVLELDHEPALDASPGTRTCTAAALGHVLVDVVAVDVDLVGGVGLDLQIDRCRPS